MGFPWRSLSMNVLLDSREVSLDARQVLLDGMPKNARAVEIGVYEGDFSARILNSTAPEMLTLIDPWQLHGGESHADALYGRNRSDVAEMERRYAQVKQRFEGMSNVTILRESSAEAHVHIPDASLDFVYIDGDHSYEGCSSDIRLYSPKLKLGGFLVGDDYLLGHWWRDGVVRSFHEALATGKFAIALKMDNQIALQRLI
jgi:hypothetical protein